MVSAPASPESAVFHMSEALRLRGRVDAGALRRALEHVVGRHATLRTRIEERRGRAIQVVESAAPVPLEEVDLSTLRYGAREAELLAGPRTTRAGPSIRRAPRSSGPCS